MQTQSLLTQTPLFQGNPLPKRKLKEEFWVSSSMEIPVFVAETPSQMLGEYHTNQLKANTLAFEEIPHLTLGEGDKGGEDSTKNWEPPTHKSFVIGQKRYEISNHLGNVSSVITDRKFGVPVSGTDQSYNVERDDNGFPLLEPHAKAFFKFDDGELTGTLSKGDLAKCNEAYKNKFGTSVPAGYTWHHHQDGKSMLLVPTALHNKYKHTGGKAVIEHNNQKGNANNQLSYPGPQLHLNPELTK